MRQAQKDLIHTMYDRFCAVEKATHADGHDNEYRLGQYHLMRDLMRIMDTDWLDAFDKESLKAA